MTGGGACWPALFLHIFVLAQTKMWAWCSMQSHVARQRAAPSAPSAAGRFWHTSRDVRVQCAALRKTVWRVARAGLPPSRPFRVIVLAFQHFFEAAFNATPLQHTQKPHPTCHRVFQLVFDNQVSIRLL